LLQWWGLSRAAIKMAVLITVNLQCNQTIHVFWTI
jgi:hypothetical protein